MKLTKRVIDCLHYEGKNNQRDVRWDDSLPGFGIRLYPTGKKSFVISYRANTRKRLMTLGTYGVLTLHQARNLAREHLVSVEKGNDPLESRQRIARGDTVTALCDTYMARHAKLRKKSWKDDQRRIERHIKPTWGNLKAISVKRADVAALHTKIGQTRPYEANRVLRLVSKIFGLARRWGFVPDDHINPAQDIELFKEEKRDRWITPQELPRLAEAIDNESNVYARQALWIYLLTGARKSELLQSKWQDIDWERKELRLPETKAGRIHYIPLSGPALSILQQLPRIEGNPYIFTGLKEGRHLVNIDKAWRRVRKAAGVEDLRLHDLRRSVGSWLAQSGNSLHLIGKVLNHSNPSTTAIYARFGEDQVRQALEQHGDRIVDTAKKKTAEKISDLQPLRIEHQEYYSNSDIDQIVKSVGNSPENLLRNDLRDSLNEFAHRYFNHKWLQENPSPSAQRKKSQAIDNAAKKLLDNLGIVGYEGDPIEQMPSILRNSLTSAANIIAEYDDGFPDFPPREFEVAGEKYLDYRGDDAVSAAIVSIQRIGQFARDAAQRQKNVVTNNRREPSHKGDESLMQLIEGLAKLYKDVFNKQPGISRPPEGSEAGGPWIRFLQACLKPLGIGFSNNQLSWRWGRMRDTHQSVKKSKALDILAQLDE